MSHTNEGVSAPKRSDILWDSVRQAVKEHSLFVADSMDDVSAQFAGLSEEARTAFVAELRGYLRDRDVTAARNHITALGMRGAKDRRARAAELGSFFVSLVLLVIVPLRLGFSFQGGMLNHAIDALVVAMYAMIVYFQGFTIPDVVCMLPMQVLSGLPQLEILRMLVLGRFVRGGRYFARSAGSRLLIIFLLLVTFAHLVACCWYYVSQVQNFGTSFGAPSELQHESFAIRYFTSFFFALKSLTGGPEGSPSTGLELALAISILMLGFSVYASLVGSIGTLLVSLDSDNQAWLDKFGSVERFIHSQHLPPDLSSRIWRHYKYLKLNSKAPSDDGLLSEMPESLQTDVALHLLSGLLSKVDFLKDAPHPMLALVVRLLRPMAIGPGERVVTQGEMGASMFFLMKGMLEVVIGLQVVGLLSEGDVFGEMSLFLATPRTATVRAITFCEVYELSRDNLDQVMDLFPSVAQALQEKMNERIRSTTELQDLKQESAEVTSQGIQQRRASRMHDPTSPRMAAFRSRPSSTVAETASLEGSAPVEVDEEPAAISRDTIPRPVRTFLSRLSSVNNGTGAQRNPPAAKPLSYPLMRLDASATDHFINKDPVVLEGVALADAGITEARAKFFIIQIIWAAGEIHIFKRWGRRGESGRYAVETCESRELAEARFADIFRSKTGNVFKRGIISSRTYQLQRCRIVTVTMIWMRKMNLGPVFAINPLDLAGLIGRYVWQTRYNEAWLGEEDFSQPLFEAMPGKYALDEEETYHCFPK